MTTIDIPTELVADGAALVDEAAALLVPVVDLARRLEAFEHAIDRDRPELAAEDADDAMLEAWCHATGAAVLRSLCEEMATALQFHLGYGAPDRRPDTTAPLGELERWRAERGGVA